VGQSAVLYEHNYWIHMGIFVIC